MTTDTCRQPGDGAGFRAHAVTRANAVDMAVDMDLLAYDGESRVSSQG